MPNTRKVALLLSIAVLTLGISQYSSGTIDPVDAPSAQSFTLVKADWCNQECDEQCGGDCATAYAVGCTCYWFCNGAGEGTSICTAAIPVMICTN